MECGSESDLANAAQTAGRHVRCGHEAENFLRLSSSKGLPLIPLRGSPLLEVHVSGGSPSKLSRFSSLFLPKFEDCPP